MQDASSVTGIFFESYQLNGCEPPREGFTNFSGPVRRAIDHQDQLEAVLKCAPQGIKDFLDTLLYAALFIEKGDDDRVFQFQFCIQVRTSTV